MKILLSGGGTAGHINPALAIASYVKEQNPEAEILFVGSKGGMEERLVPQAGFDIQTVEVAGFQRKISLRNVGRNLRALYLVFAASAQAGKIIREFAPDVCVGTGGYVCGPVLRKAAQMGIPVLVHESNAFPGMTTKMLAKWAKAIMVSVSDAGKHLPDNCPIVVTGNPIREEIVSYDPKKARQELGLDERPVVLSFGGSLGAERVNRAILELIVHSTKTDKYQHIHAYGQYGKWFPEELEARGAAAAEHKNLDIREYIHDMPRCLAAADLVISRCGAMTLSEIQAKGKASILIPSPNVAENHQYHNARALVDRQAAELIEEKDLSGETLTAKATALLDRPERLKTYSENARKMAITNADERIYHLITAQLPRESRTT